jgi:hypothetical protein
MNIALNEEKQSNEITKKWLKDNPYDPIGSLPKGWEIRFGKRGMFLKYDSVEHAERKNMITLRSGIITPFGYCNSSWERLKANLQPNDEIWRYGGDGGEAIFLIRDNCIVAKDSIGLSCY